MWARTSTRATGALQSYFYSLKVFRCSICLTLLMIYSQTVVISSLFFRSQSSSTNWKKALDAWFWDEIDLFPVSSVYRFVDHTSNHYKLNSTRTFLGIVTQARQGTSVRWPGLRPLELAAASPSTEPTTGWPSEWR